MNIAMENWYLYVVAVCLVVVTIAHVAKFKSKPTEEQITTIKKWLLIAVTECEAQLGSKTGRLKLSMCYDMFVKALPALAAIVPFEMFQALVDEVLIEMKDIIKNQPEAIARLNDAAR